MRVRSLIASGALAAGTVLAFAAPANAATTYDEITDVEVVHVDGDNFIHGVYGPWEDEGPATFPSIVNANELGEQGSYVLQAYTPVLPEIPAECRAEIVSFVVDFELLLDTGTNGAELGFYVGVPANAVDGTTMDFAGVGSAGPSGGYFTVAPVERQLDGVATVVLPAPIAADEVPFGWLGFFTGAQVEGEQPMWQVNSVKFVVATTCPDPAEPTRPTPPAAVETAAPAAAESAAVAVALLVIAIAGAIGAVTLTERRRG